MPQPFLATHIMDTHVTTLTELARVRGQAEPDRLLYRFLGRNRDEQMTFGQLHTGASAIAAGLVEIGRPGDRVMLFFRPGLAYIRAFFGCLYAGRIAVPLYPPRADQKGQRVTGALADCGAAVALTEPGEEGAIRGLLAAMGLEGIEVLPIPSADTTVAGFTPVKVGPEDIAFLQYTSGSTGSPKGVMVSHGNLMANQAAIGQAFATSERDICFNWLPLYHDMGLIGNVLHPLYAGFPSILTSPVDFIRDPMSWLEGISDKGATIAGAPDFAYALLCRRADPQRAAQLDLSRWRVAYNGAEPVRAETLAAFAARFGAQGFDAKAFYPCYGMAEATLFISGGNVTAPPRTLAVDKRALGKGMAIAGDETVLLTSCGQAMPAHELRIVDPETRATLPSGRVGEIWFRGPSKAKGYWQKDDLNRATFEAVTAEGNGAWLRTGDLGFQAEDALYVTGRLKDLMIVRGRNHYPQDIEQTAESVASVFNAGGAAAFTLEKEGEERLAIAMEVNRKALEHFDAEAAAALVRDAVARDHEITVETLVFLRPGTLPKTSSGKKQRLATRALYLQSGLEVVSADEIGERSASQVWRPEEGSMEHRVRELIAAGMRRKPERIRLEEALTAQGLDSMAAIEIQQGLSTELGISVTLLELLGGITPETLCRRALETESEGASTLPEVGAWAVDEAIPLSLNQEPLYFHHALDGDAAPHNLSFATRLASPIDPQRLERSLKRLLARHPILAAAYREVGHHPFQSRGAASDVELTVLAGQDLNAEAVNGFVARMAQEPFDLARGRVFRVGLIASDKPVLVVCVHHIAVDFRALAVLIEDLADLYADRARALPYPHGFKDFVFWQRDRYDRGEMEASRRHWEERLAGNIPVIALPRDRDRRGRSDHAGDRHAFALSRTLTDRLKALATAHQTTLYTVALTAYLRFLHRYTGQANIAVGTPISQRQRPEFARIVGYLANMVVIRGQARQGASFTYDIRETHRLVMEALAHGDFPFHLLVKRLAPERTAYHPLFQTAFVLQETDPERDFGPFALGLEDGQVRLADWEMSSLAIPTVGSQFDLTLTLAETRGGLAARIDYATACFDERTIVQFATCFTHFLEESAQRADAAWVPIMSTSNRNQMLALAGMVETTPAHETLMARFAKIADQYPDQIALTHAGTSLTYRELWRRALALAATLQAHGVGSEARVGLFCAPTAEMIVGILGILQSGAAYVPLDPNYPRERLTYLIEDSAVALILADEPSRIPLETEAEILDLAEMANAPANHRLTQIDPNQAAYVIYTSGSTGRPKGTVVNHANVMRLFLATENRFDFSSADCWTLFHSFAFDFSVWEIWGALLYGGRLLIVDKSVTRSPDQFAELVYKERVTVLNQTPSAFTPLIPLMCRRPPQDNPLRFVIFGGEALTVRNLQPLFDHFGAARPRLINMYGITETTVHVTWREIETEDLTQDRSPIGLPIADLKALVLDAALEPRPQGVTGELFIGDDPP